MTESIRSERNSNSMLASIETKDIFKELIYRGMTGERFDPGVIQRLMAFTKDGIDKGDIATRVKKVIGSCFDLEEVNTSDNLRTDYNMDSLDEVELLMALETEFGVEIPDDDIISWTVGNRQILTTGDVIDLVRDKMKSEEI